MRSKWTYFSIEELSCHCDECRQNGQCMDDMFMQKIVSIRKVLGVPFVVTSAYRCQAYNTKIGGVPNSAHTEGRAMDISIDGMEEAKQVQLIEEAIRHGVKGIGIQGKGSSQFIHLDDTRPRLWTY